MTPLEALYEQAKKNKREGKKVISVEYVIEQFEKEMEMYVFKPPDKALEPDRDTLIGLDVQTYQTMVKGL